MKKIITDINMSEDLPIVLNDKINSCLVNLYENGNDKISRHKDSSDSFGNIPTIVNLSIGQTRILRLINNEETIDFPLEHNSLFIMAGSSQKNYTHEIIEDKTITKKRYSLTFRELL
jgi:alkylated DNA repair dioxygenase AlkB